MYRLKHARLAATISPVENVNFSKVVEFDIQKIPDIANMKAG